MGSQEKFLLVSYTCTLWVLNQDLTLSSIIKGGGSAYELELICRWGGNLMYCFLNI